MAAFNPTINISEPGAFASPTKCKCLAAPSAGAPLVPFEITRRALGPTDIAIQTKFAGICHSDIHQAREEWGPAIFPMVPGHEIGGVVAAVGAAVTKFKVGDLAGVGCMVDACRRCEPCTAGEEQYCSGGGMVGTYNSRFKHAHCEEYNDGAPAPTYGGYSESVVVDEAFALRMPDTLDLAAATPLLCAGITVYSPMMYYGLRPNQRFAVVGLGGLGHMALKFAVAFGCDVTVISRGTGKRDEALGRLGAHHFIDSTDAAAMADAKGRFDFILDTVAADHDVGALMDLLRVNGKCIMVGIPPNKVALHGFKFIPGRKMLAGSLIGGIRETQEMLDFCGRHGITCDVEMVGAADVNAAYERTIAADVKYRFVIDAASILALADGQLAA